MKSKALMVATILAAVAAPASALAKDKPDTLVPKAGAEPVDCIQLRQIRESDVRSDSIIDFRMSGGKIYRNTLPNSCSQLGFERRFAYQTSLSQLCSVDIITVLNNIGPGISRGASCGLGKFQEMTDTKKATKNK